MNTRSLAAVVLSTGLALALAACEEVPKCGQAGGADGSGSGPTYAASGASDGSDGDPCDPPPDCDSPCPGGSGEPHVRTFDGRKFDLQTAAELVVARSPDGAFEVQWRQEPFGASRASGITAVAVKMGSSRIMVEGAGEEVHLDGDPVVVAEGEPRLLPSGVAVHREGRRISIINRDRSAIVQVLRDDAAMTVVVDSPDEHAGFMEGLLGNDDGNPNNDIRLADGTLIEKASFAAVHPELAEMWRVTDANTLFDYVDGEGPDTYWDPSFPSQAIRLEDFSEADRAAAEEACRAAGVSDEDLLANCVFDVLATGDDVFPELYADEQLATGQELAPQPPSPDPVDDEPTPDNVPPPAWDITLDDHAVEHDRGEMRLDGAGHVLVQARNLTTEREELVAVDLADGSIAWTVPDIARDCTVAVGPSGLVFAQLVPESPTAGADNPSADLVAIDPATGELVDGLRHTAPGTDDEPPLNVCHDELRVAPSGQVLLHQVGGFRLDAMLWSFSVVGDALTVDWTVTYDFRRPYAPPTVTADGTGVYMVRRTDADVRPLVVDRVDLATGATVATSEGLGSGVQAEPVADGGGLLVAMVRATGEELGGRSAEELVRLADDGSSLGVDWRLVFHGDVPFEVDGSTFDEAYGFRTLAVAGNLVLGNARGRLLAVDWTSGEPVWAVDEATSSDADHLAVGPDGTLYESTKSFTWLVAIDTGGTVVWEVAEGGPPRTPDLSGALQLGPVTPDDSRLPVLATAHEDGVLHLLLLPLP